MSHDQTIIGEPDSATPLEPEELEGLMHRHVATRGQLDQLEQINITDGLKWLRNRRKKDILDEGFVLELHRKLFGQVWSWAGRFRKTEKNIGCDPVQIAIQLRQCLDDTRYWVEHETYEPLEIAVRFHHGLVKIHPFANGNGRHARIIANALLTQVLKVDPVDWSGGEDLQKMSDRRKAYIQALRAADNHDFTPLLAFVSGKK